MLPVGLYMWPLQLHLTHALLLGPVVELLTAINHLQQLLCYRLIKRLVRISAATHIYNFIRSLSLLLLLHPRLPRNPFANLILAVIKLLHNNKCCCCCCCCVTRSVIVWGTPTRTIISTDDGRWVSKMATPAICISSHSNRSSRRRLLFAIVVFPWLKHL